MQANRSRFHLRASVDHVNGPAAKTLPPSTAETREISVWRFFTLTYLLGWGVAIIAILLEDTLKPIFGEIGYTHPVFILAVYSPGIAAIYLIWRRYGFRALGDYFRRLTLWRLPGKWWLLLLLGIPVAKYVGAAFNGSATEFPFDPWYDVLPAFVAALLIGPVEEFGWRGLALPLLQRRYTPLTASLVLGAFWGMWHLPAFLLSGTPQSAWSLGPYLIGVMSLAIILTPIFNAARGSILIAMIYHFQMNGPAWPDAQPWENYIFAAIAILVVAFSWRAMTTRVGAATEIFATGNGTPVETDNVAVRPLRGSATHSYSD